MLTGIDTSFFYALAAGRPGAVDAWENRELITSTLCFFELRKRILNGDLRAWPTVLEDIAHETGMPAMDSILISQFVEAGCEEILTLDHHFSLFAKKGLTITLLSD
jgi:predicted nucleic acid-binding protein